MSRRRATSKDNQELRDWAIERGWEYLGLDGTSRMVVRWPATQKTIHMGNAGSRAAGPRDLLNIKARMKRIERGEER